MIKKSKSEVIMLDIQDSCVIFTDDWTIDSLCCTNFKFCHLLVMCVMCVLEWRTKRRPPPPPFLADSARRRRPPERLLSAAGGGAGVAAECLCQKYGPYSSGPVPGSVSEAGIVKIWTLFFLHPFFLGGRTPISRPPSFLGFSFGGGGEDCPVMMGGGREREREWWWCRGKPKQKNSFKIGSAGHCIEPISMKGGTDFLYLYVSHAHQPRACFTCSPRGLSGPVISLFPPPPPSPPSVPCGRGGCGRLKVGCVDTFVKCSQPCVFFSSLSRQVFFTQLIHTHRLIVTSLSLRHTHTHTLCVWQISAELREREKEKEGTHLKAHQLTDLQT